ncbi:hypothetical protein SAMN05518672_10654 [Chitinophaga sp. CF118]|uniref:hypothetical protein n=1 Tax=Chitinophaga sp. CF118 TaxID=1884367 RepID=UPI0008EDA03A|nr:hypothetical protein [Chitinophaga sp. CF118]SFE41667.1 hypothetical protein SAMN05518672_10654 [Chitinophaga sp. CF118]
MISYNSKTLDNIEVIEAAEKALHKKCITAEEYQQIKTAYPVDLYTPNPYVRIGLFILTVIIVFFSFGLFCLLTMNGGEKAIGVLTFIFGLGCYAAIEYMVHEKKHHKSGVDTALMWMSGSAIITAVFIITDMHMPPSLMCLLVLLPATFFVLRFADVLMSVVAFLSFLALLYCILISAGWMIIPFTMMGASFAVYLAAVQLAKVQTYRHYLSCLQMLQIVSLITLYLAGNYFVVREVSNEMFNLYLLTGESIPGGWIFWIFTIILPPLYIFAGIRKKDRILIRTGLFLIAGIVFTIRAYHSVAPIEVAMTLGGIVLIAVAYGITKLLQPSRKGFTSEQTDDDVTDAIQLESLIIAQSFHQGGTQGDHFDFGGGSGSGGGASGTY